MLAPLILTNIMELPGIASLYIHISLIKHVETEYKYFDNRNDKWHKTCWNKLNVIYITFN